MTTFSETNGRIHSMSVVAGSGKRYYATCGAGSCTWVGPLRETVASAKRDAVAHHKDDRAY